MRERAFLAGQRFVVPEVAHRVEDRTIERDGTAANGGQADRLGQVAVARAGRADQRQLCQANSIKRMPG